MKDISISSTTIFSYNLGCGDESPKFVVSPEGEGWVRVNVTGNSFTVNVDPYDGEGIRTADVKIRFGDTVCSGGIKVRQEGSGGGEPTECTTWKEQVWAKWNGYQYDRDSLIDEVESCRGEVQLELNGHYRCENPSPSNYTNYSPRTIWKVVQGGAYAHLSSTESSAVTVFIDENNDDARRQVELAFSGFCYHDDSELATPAYPTGNRVIIRQAAGPCEEQDTCNCNSINVTSIENLSYTSGNNVNLASVNSENIDADCINRFSFTSDSNFISNIRISNGNVVGNISENSSENDRTATITVMFDTNITCTSFAITQEGRDEPETREYEFDVDFGDLRDDAFTYVDSGDYSGQTHTISVSSRTKTTSETNWSWADIDYEFSEGLLPIGAAGFKLTQKSSQGYVREYEVSITGTPENHEVQNIRLVITQRDNPHATERVKARYFNFAGFEPDYIYNEIRPFIVQVPYEQNRSTLCYLFFKSYGDMKDEQREIKVNKKVIFFASSDDVFVTRISDGQCAGTTNTRPGEGSKPYILSGESSNYEPSYKLSDISSRGVFIREISQQCMQNQFTYDQNETKLSFKLDGTDCLINGYKGSDGFPDSCRDGVNDVCLIIPRNQDIETISADTIIRKTSQVIFDDGDSGPVTVSVYENGVAFVDSAQTSVATVNECFQNITQFVNTVYPSGYNNEIQSCTLFNFEDLEEHCIYDIVIEDGELIRRDESIPSPTRAMHIELDEEPSDTQAMHIETDNN